MFSFNDKISIRQLQILLILDIFGTGVIVLPRYVAEYANQDGWIVIILSTLVALFCTYVITTLGGMFPRQAFYEYTSRIVSRPLSVLITIGFIIKLILNISWELRFFAEILKEVMLCNTPFFIIFISILLVAGYAAAKGYETRARLAEILIFIVFIPLIIVFLIASFNVDFSNIMPIMKTNFKDLLQGGFYTLSSFTGIELALLVFPNIKSPHKVRKAAMESVLIIGIFMIIITIITISRFGSEEIKFQMWPIISMMDTIDIPGSFLERQEALIMSFWIVSVFSIVNAGLFFSSIMMKSIVKKGKHSYYIVIFIFLALLVSFLPRDIVDTYKFINITFFTFDLAYMFFIPIILLVIAKLRGIGIRR